MWSPRPRPSKPAPDTGVGDVGEREGTCVREDAWPGVLWGWRGRGVRAAGGDSPSLPLSRWHSSLEAQFATGEEKLRLFVALRR